MGCNAGDYCTHDSAGLTYCCPDGMSLEACAAAYSLTGALETALPTPTATASDSVEPVATITDDDTEPTATESLNTPSATETDDDSGEATLTLTFPGEETATATGPGSPEFTGGAAKMARAGMAVLAGAAVFL